MKPTTTQGLTSACVIRSLSLNDLDAVAKLHVAAFESSALSFLGPRVVKEYYGWQLSGPHDCLSIGAFDSMSGSLVGFCFAGRFRGALSGFLIRNIALIGAKLLRHPGLLLNSRVVQKIPIATVVLVRFILARLSLKHTNRVTHEPEFGILSIATDPASIGRGIGSSLMESVEKQAISLNVKRLVLSVAPENLRAIRFYESNGWQRELKGSGWDGRMLKVIS